MAAVGESLGRCQGPEKWLGDIIWWGIDQCALSSCIAKGSPHQVSLASGQLPKVKPTPSFPVIDHPGPMVVPLELRLLLQILGLGWGGFQFLYLLWGLEMGPSSLLLLLLLLLLEASSPLGSRAWEQS